MKISKEVKTGFIAILAIGLLVAGVNFLKGNSFFGGDDEYYAYFPNSGGLAPSGSVTVNGVIIGKIMSVDVNPRASENQRVKIAFNIQDEDIRIPKGSVIEIGSLDLFNKGMILTLNSDISRGYYEPGSSMQGFVKVDLMDQVKSYVDPIGQKLQKIMGSVDKVVNSISSLWDTTATSELEGSMREVKLAISNFSHISSDLEDLVATEKVQLHKIIGNVESITNNLKLSNEKITQIVGNAQKITDDLVSADFKAVVGDAQKTIQKLNGMLEDVSAGNGTMGKLLKDEKLYNELVNTNKELQNLVNDLQLHPERYIHFSVLGAKTKGVPLTSGEEKKLRKLLDSIPQQ